jgi:hypothetical protein
VRAANLAIVDTIAVADVEAFLGAIPPDGVLQRENTAGNAELKALASMLCATAAMMLRHQAPGWRYRPVRDLGRSEGAAA